MSDEITTNSLVFKIENKANIELDDLVISLNGLSSQYAKFVSEKNNNPNGQNLKLYIREIKKGSVIADLFSATAVCGTITFLENAITILEYTKYLKSAYEYFLGKKEKEKDFSKQDLKNLRNIVEPIAKDNGSQLIIQNCNNITFNLNSDQANIIQNKIKREEEIFNIRNIKNTPFTLFKTRIPQDLTTGFSGIIPEINKDRPITTIFQDIATRDKIINIPENPLQKEFLVDVTVFFENDIPVKYQITNVY